MNLSSTPEFLREKVVLSQDKLKDIQSLLENRFGPNWKSQKNLNYFLQFFKNGGKKGASKGKAKDEELEVIDEVEECTCCEEDEATFLQ